MADNTSGKANGTVWFQQAKSEATKAEAAFLNAQIRRVQSVITKLQADGKSIDRRFKSQAREKVNLLKAAVDYANGKRAYFPIPRVQRAQLPKDGVAFMAVVMGEVNDIPLMFERANIPGELR